MVKKIKIVITVIIIAILTFSTVYYFVLFGQKGNTEFTSETLEDYDGKNVSIIGVVNGIPVGVTYGYRMEDGVEWNGKLLSNVIVDFEANNIIPPANKKIQINGTVRALRYITEYDGRQHLVDSEGRLYDPTVIIAKEIRVIPEDELHFDYVYGEELMNRTGERISVNGTFWTAKGFNFISINGNHSKDTQLFLDTVSLYDQFINSTNGTVEGIIEKRILSFGDCMIPELRQVCGDHLIYGIRVESIKSITEKEKFIGKWTGEISNLSGTWNLTFYINGSLLSSYYVGIESSNIPPTWGQYKVEKGHVCLKLNDTSDFYCDEYNFSNNNTYLQTFYTRHFMLTKIQN